MNLSVDENNPATFAVNDPSALPLQYQWYREGSPISGANSPIYTILPTIIADYGATFSVTVSKVSPSLTSRTAMLTVVPDITGPQPVEVFSTNLTHVVVRYNEVVDLFSGGESFNYIVLELNTAVNAILQPDGKTVIIELVELLLAGSTYDIHINDVTDFAGNPMDPTPEVLTFTAGTDQPRLTVKRNGANVQLSWPVTAAGYILEQTTALQSPSSSTVWTPVGLAPFRCARQEQRLGQRRFREQGIPPSSLIHDYRATLRRIQTPPRPGESPAFCLSPSDCSFLKAASVDAKPTSRQSSSRIEDKFAVQEPPRLATRLRNVPCRY